MDAEEWAKRTEIPVYPGKVQRWILVRHGDDDVSQAEAETDARDALAHWLGFPHRGLMPGVQIVSSTASLEQPAIGRRMGRRREELPELVTVKGNKPWWIVLDWTSTSNRTELPWPVLTRDLAGWDWRPSMEADWLLWAVDRPRDPSPEEKPKTTEEKLEKLAKDTGKSITTALKTLGGLAAAAAVIYVVGNLVRRT